MGDTQYGTQCPNTSLVLLLSHGRTAACHKQHDENKQVAKGKYSNAGKKTLRTTNTVQH